MQTTRVFTNGNSQAVRLPKEFRFASSEVFIRKDVATGDIVLSSRAHSGSWADFFALRAKTRVPVDFLSDRPLNEIKPARDPFAVAHSVKPPRRK
ncbi:MAG: AbrB/MazE/SpoVT family DNA-binding domain-containing protein [Betaproteobacteria bacterium]|nr:MAG: AbrB/MazE/SpoVT family DNA-binding domain-containing protein [Betaproteobacteria bacterium]